MPIDLIRLYHENRVHGFRRYPDAILPFVEMEADEKRRWWDRSQWEVTFYSRAPEFSPLGLSRLFLLKQPSPQVCGPAHQLPFSKAGRGYPQALFGFPANSGFSAPDSDERKAVAALLLDSGRALMETLSADWPGYGGTLRGRYGDEESAQIVLNLLAMGQFATAEGVADPQGLGRAIAAMNYCGEKTAPGATIPDRFCWRLDSKFEVDPFAPPMLPQTPGPHINEIKFVVTPEEVIEEGHRHILLKYHYEVEYYLHPGHPLGDTISAPPFPVKVDYLKLDTSGGEVDTGTADESGGGGVQEFDEDDWDDPKMRPLQTAPPAQIGRGELNHRVVTSRKFYLGSSADEPTTAREDAIRFDPVFDPTVNFKVNLRIGLGLLTGPWVKDLIPLGGKPEDTLEAELDLDLTFPDPEHFVSWEAEDPRVCGSPVDWNRRIGADSMGRPNSNQPEDEKATEYSKFKYVEAGGAFESESTAATRFPSPGYLSMIHTGMRGHQPWRTLKLTRTDDNPPDWLLLEAFAPAFCVPPGLGASRTLPDHWMALSHMNSTAGKVNLNNKVYPESEWFKPPARSKALKGVFRHLREDDDVDRLIRDIEAHQSSSRVFEYVGELSEVGSYAAGETDWERESLLRNCASLLTTQSNTFGVWGVAQSVKKAPGGEKYAELEANDAVLAEKRFYALVERYVWPGRDGIPGNGHTNPAGNWDELGREADGSAIEHPGQVPAPGKGAVWAEIDGPAPVGSFHQELAGDLPHSASSLAEADNPAQAVVCYRVVYFKFLDH